MNEKRTILDNGLNILCLPMKKQKMFAVGFFIMVGGRNESIEVAGISHFLEHMMFQGTTNRNAIQLSHDLDSLGAVWNAVTTHEITYYYFVGHIKDHVKLIDIALDIYLNPAFPKKEIDREKKVILEEKKYREDRPSSKLYSTLMKHMYYGTSLSKNVIGTNESIMDFDKSTLQQYHDTYYRPSNTLFIVSGDINCNKITNMISPILSELKNPTLPLYSYLHEKDTIKKIMSNQTEPNIVYRKEDSISQLHMTLAFHLGDLNDEYSDELTLLSYILGNGFSSRLNTGLRQKHGISYGSHAGIDVNLTSSIFYIDVELNPPELIPAITIIMKELKKLKTKLIDEAELQKVKTMYINNNIMEDTPLEYLLTYGLEYVFNLSDPKYHLNLKDSDANINKIKAIDLQKLAKKIFIHEHINIFICGMTNVTNFDFITL